MARGRRLPSRLIELSTWPVRIAAVHAAIPGDGRDCRAEGRPNGPTPHRMPPQRSAQSVLARYRGRRHQPSRFEDWPARRASRRGRAGARRRAAPSARPGCVPVSALRRGAGQSSLIACWRAVCADAQLGSLRLHDLRHTAASEAVMAGEGLPLVGRLLGHNRHRTTAGYAHRADAHLVEAAEKVGAAIAATMNYPEEAWTTPQHRGMLTLSQCIDDECKNTHVLPHRTDHLLLTPRADERLRSAISRQYDVLPR